jgi:C-terminal processing protease CtpA/Prc
LPARAHLTMKKRHYLAYLFGVLSLLASCKTAEKGEPELPGVALTQEGMLADYRLFRDLYEKANPGLYDFHSKETIDSLFSANEKKINQRTNYREFYNIIWGVVDFTGSIHNNLFYPDTLKKQLEVQPIFFPLPVLCLNDELHTSSSLGGIPLASKIVSVNGMKAAELLEKAAFYRSTDGYNKTEKYASMARVISSWYLYLALGPQKDFVIEYEDEQQQVRQVTLPAVPYKTFEEAHAARHAKHLQEFKEKYTFRFVDSLNAGILTVNTFALGGGEEPSHLKYAAFLDSVFTFLDERAVEHLVVDVRKNGGGNNPNQTLLFSYLTDRQFRMTTSGYTIFNQVHHKPHYVESIPDEIRIGEAILQKQYSVQREGRFYIADKYNPVFSPQQNSFRGSQYLLVSPGVASAGSLFASMVKSDGKAQVIGEETGGGYLWHTGNFGMVYKLPNSGLLLKFSIVSLAQDVKPLQDQAIGQGIMPHVEVKLTREDYLQGRDTQLEWVLNTIRQHTSKELQPGGN